ncbi:hypothetical protein JXA70_03360 [candidate division KSB1 bacterium]|nr:hypothetical protein [candidate division KSB1 bacterium]
MPRKVDGRKVEWEKGKGSRETGDRRLDGEGCDCFMVVQWLPTGSFFRKLGMSGNFIML